jgi:hypothetical protein
VQHAESWSRNPFGAKHENERAAFDPIDAFLLEARFSTMRTCFNTFLVRASSRTSSYMFQASPYSFPPCSQSMHSPLAPQLCVSMAPTFAFQLAIKSRWSRAITAPLIARALRFDQ